MNIAIIGYGNMGREVEKAALKKNHTIVQKVDPRAQGADTPDISKHSLSQADVCIEFTHPDSVVKNIKKVMEIGLPMVVGTTKWFDHLKEIEKLVKEKNGSVIYAPNFSLGMNIFFKICETAAAVMNYFDDYDPGGFESHHNRKADAPSGTAKKLSRILTDNLDRKTTPVFHLGDRKIKPEELHFSSLRTGSIPGTHQIIFDSDPDTITLTHSARNRQGFAAGALTAAEWIINKKGIYSFDEMMNELIT
ncbi:MAG: 4-hydroxy-tetrahydrodipicolinate reductase [bacterium]